MMITELDPNTALVLIDFQKSNAHNKLAKPIAEVLANVVKLVKPSMMHRCPW